MQRETYDSLCFKYGTWTFSVMGNYINNATAEEEKKCNCVRFDAVMQWVSSEMEAIIMWKYPIWSHDIFILLFVSDGWSVTNRQRVCSHSGGNNIWKVATWWDWMYERMDEVIRTWGHMIPFVLLLMDKLFYWTGLCEDNTQKTF